MKACEETRHLLQHSLDDEITAEEEWRIEKHVEACSDCRAVQQQLTELSDLFSEIAEIDRVEPTRLAPPRPSRPLAVAASLALTIALVGVGLLVPPPDPTSPPEVVATGPAFEITAPTEKCLVVNLPSGHADVHVAWVYTLPPAKGTRR